MENKLSLRVGPVGLSHCAGSAVGYHLSVAVAAAVLLLCTCVAMTDSTGQSDVISVGRDYRKGAIIVFATLIVLNLAAIPLWRLVSFDVWHVVLLLFTALLGAFAAVGWILGPPVRIDFQRGVVRGIPRPFPLAEVQAVLLARVERRGSDGDYHGEAWHPVLLHDLPHPVRRSIGKALLQSWYRYEDHPAALEFDYGIYRQFWMHASSAGEAIRAAHQIARRLHIPLIDATQEPPALIEPHTLQSQRGATRFISTRPSSLERIPTNTSDIPGVRRIDNVLTIHSAWPVWQLILGAVVVIGILAAVASEYGTTATLFVTAPLAGLLLLFTAATYLTRAHHRRLRIDPAGIHFYRGTSNTPHKSIPHQDLFGVNLTDRHVVLVGEEAEIYLRGNLRVSVEELYAVVTEHLEQLRPQRG